MVRIGLPRVIFRVGQNRIYTFIRTVYDRVFSDFPAKKIYQKLYTVLIWLWPNLVILHVWGVCVLLFWQEIL
jgi:hypothetical protein